jgi:glycosyltransferase involved in cell wall biosynthesis
MVRPHTRVLHVNSIFSPEYTGEGIFIERLTPTMDALCPGVQHDVLAVYTPRPPKETSHNCKLITVFYLNDRPTKKKTINFKLIFWLAKNAHRYDVVHFHTHVDRSLICYFILKFLRKRLVISATLDDSVKGILQGYRWGFRGLAKAGMMLFDRFIAISPKLHEENLSSVPKKKCDLIPIGIQIPPLRREDKNHWRKILGLSHSATVLVFVGSISSRKDPGFLVRQLQHLKKIKNEIVLLIVGPIIDKEYANDMMKYIAENNLENNIIITGKVNEPWGYYYASDIMVFSSHLEGFGTAMIEGMAFGLPIIARHLPGVNDSFIMHKKTGYLFKDEEDFRSYTSILIQTPRIADSMGRAGRHFVSKTYAMPLIAKKYLAVYGLATQHSLLGNGESEPTPWHRVAGYSGRVAVVGPVGRPDPPRLTHKSMKPTLITTIDAEEEFDWKKPFSRNSTSIDSMLSQEKAQKIFSKYNVTPTYFIDYPVASQDKGVSVLKEFLTDKSCIIGTQLHPWVTPPFEEKVNRFNSYLGNLPLPLQYEKILTMVRITEDRLGVRPTIFRSGRYGIGRRTAEVLLDLGFNIDSSIMSRWNFSQEGGPDFSAFSSEPFWLEKNEGLLELPLTCEYVGHSTLRRMGIGKFSHSRIGEVLRIPGVLARSGILERIKLSPEGVTLKEAMRLTRRLVDDGQRIFVLSYHSPSLAVGNTPYVQTAADLERFLFWLDEYFAFFLEDIGGQMSTPEDVRKRLLRNSI